MSDGPVATRLIGRVARLSFGLGLIGILLSGGGGPIAGTSILEVLGVGYADVVFFASLALFVAGAVVAYKCRDVDGDAQVDSR